MNEKYKVLNIEPSDIAKYYVYRASVDGDLITPLKMQKLVYFAYGAHLARKKEKLFKESIEAWPNGPVVPTLYRDLKKYGSSPIDSDFARGASEQELLENFSNGVRETLDLVYENYITKSAFELVSLTHQQKAWSEARKGLKATDKSNKPLNDSLIMQDFQAGHG